MCQGVRTQTLYRGFYRILYFMPYALSFKRRFPIYPAPALRSTFDGSHDKMQDKFKISPNKNFEI